MIGGAFSFPLFIFAAVYRIYRPDLADIAIADEIFGEEEIINMNLVDA
jgi:hypothetical protein